MVIVKILNAKIVKKWMILMMKYPYEIIIMIKVSNNHKKLINLIISLIVCKIKDTNNTDLSKIKEWKKKKKIIKIK